MKKVLLTAALFFTVFAASAQKSVVKEAKSEKSNPAKAAKIIEPALKNPETMYDPETWKLAGDFQKSIYDDENMKMYLPGGKEKVNKKKLYNSLAKMFNYYLKCDEMEQAQVAKGEMKKAKMRGKISKALLAVRPNLINAGSDTYNEGNYKDALKYFGLYVDSQSEPMFAESKEIKADTLVGLIANYAVLAANSLKDNKHVLKYAKVGKEDKTEGYRSLMCMAEVYGKSETPDSTKWLAAIEEGVEKFPSQEYFIGNLMDFYIQKGKIAEGLAKMDNIIAKNPTPYFLYVKGVLEYESKDYNAAISTLTRIVEMNKDFVGEAYAKMGDCFFFPAQQIIEDNSKLAMDDPKYAAGEAKIKELYEKAKPYYEKAKAAKPDNKQLWGQYLLNIYWKLNKAEYDALEKELGY